MYLVGKFVRSDFSWSNDPSLSCVFFKSEVTKENLLDCKNDEEYQVINILKREYYDPKLNQWVKITSL